MLDKDSLSSFTCLRNPGLSFRHGSSVSSGNLALLEAVVKRTKHPQNRGGEKRGFNKADFRPRGTTFKLPRLELRGLARRQADIHCSLSRQSIIPPAFLMIVYLHLPGRPWCPFKRRRCSTGGLFRFDQLSKFLTVSRRSRVNI